MVRSGDLLTSSANHGYDDAGGCTRTLHQHRHHDSDHETPHWVVNNLALGQCFACCFPAKKLEGCRHHLQGADERVQQSQDAEDFEQAQEDPFVHDTVDFLAGGKI